VGEPGVSDAFGVGATGDASRFVFDAVPVGVVVQRPDGIALDANRAAERLLGLTLAQMQDIATRAPAWRAYRRDGTVIKWSEHASMLALTTEQPTSGFEMGVDTPDGRRRWLQVEAVPFHDDTGALAGAVTSFVDITDRVESDDRLRLTLEATETGTWDWAIDADRIVWSTSTDRVHGRTTGEAGITFAEYVETIHPDDRDLVVDAIIRAVEKGEPYELDFRIVRPDGTPRWVAANGRVLRDAVGTPVRMVGTTQDITRRKTSELEREAGQRRLAFLAQATSVLAQSLDYETTLSRLAHLAVPFLADWCGVDVVEPDHTIRRVAVAYADADQVDAARRLSTPPDPSWEIGIPHVIRTGAPQVFAHLDDATLDALADGVPRLDLFREIGLHSLIVMPLIARGRTLGAIWFAMAETPHTYGPVDVDLAQELARRAALAVDNARLFRERKHVADVLQRTLLPPELPSIPGMEVSARYRAAIGEGTDIGGDFYDVYATGRDAWHVVIGDVCGKGPEAASLTGLARHTLRAAAMQETTPSAVLSVLNEAILRADPGERFCTAAYASVARRTDDGGVVRMTLACGGHPLPLVLRADGTVETIGRPGTLIGSLPDPELVDVDVDLAPGDAVVFCTDGVTEATGKRGFFGANRLRDLVAVCAGLDADGIAERLVDEVLAFQDNEPRDDVAIVVLRSNPGV
jgi:PAS domain S-box-containing protein